MGAGQPPFPFRPVGLFFQDFLDFLRDFFKLSEGPGLLVLFIYFGLSRKGDGGFPG